MAEPGKQAFTFSRADSIGIEGNNFHKKAKKWPIITLPKKLAIKGLFLEDVTFHTHNHQMSIAHQFLQLAIEKNVLKLGEFTLKSGRISPYFFNAGLFDDGRSLHLVGDYLAQTLEQSGIVFDGLFGPAYKGIPLATTLAIAYQQRYGRNLPVTFDRKEIKDHGEGGQVMGATLKGRILIVDDVVSVGTSVRHSIELINQSGAQAVGVAVLLDRQEKGQQALSAMQELQQQFKLKTTAIAGLDDLMAMLPDDSGDARRVADYRQRYGC